MNDRYFFRNLLDRMIKGRFSLYFLLHAVAIDVSILRIIAVNLWAVSWVADVGQQKSSRKQLELSKRLHQLKAEAEQTAARTS